MVLFASGALRLIPRSYPRHQLYDHFSNPWHFYILTIHVDNQCDVCQPVAIEPLVFDGSGKFSKVVSNAVLDSVDGTSIFHLAFRDSRSLHRLTAHADPHTPPPLPPLPSTYPLSPPPTYRSVYHHDPNNFPTFPSY